MKFEAAFNHNSLLGYKKSKNLYDEIQNLRDVEGDTAEVGVFRGHTSKLIHLLLADRTHYAYDTFCGIKGSDPSVDRHLDGEFSAGLESVKEIINMDDVIYKVGLFPDTFSEENKKFCLVHSDTDTYFGTKATLARFAPLIVQGGKIIFDDYDWYMCPGVKKAVEEFKLEDDNFTYKVYDNSYRDERDSTSINQCVLTRK